MVDPATFCVNEPTLYHINDRLDEAIKKREAKHGLAMLSAKHPVMKTINAELYRLEALAEMRNPLPNFEYLFHHAQAQGETWEAISNSLSPSKIRKELKRLVTPAITAAACWRLKNYLLEYPMVLWRFENRNPLVKINYQNGSLSVDQDVVEFLTTKGYLLDASSLPESVLESMSVPASPYTLGVGPDIQDNQGDDENFLEVILKGDEQSHDEFSAMVNSKKEAIGIPAGNYRTKDDLREDLKKFVFHAQNLPYESPNFKFWKMDLRKTIWFTAGEDAKHLRKHAGYEEATICQTIQEFDAAMATFCQDAK